MKFLHLLIVVWIVIASSLVEAKKGNGKKGKKHHDGKKRRHATPLNSLRSSSSGQAFASLSNERRLGKKGKGGGSDDDDQNLIEEDDDSPNNNNNNNDKNDDVEDLDQRFETSMFLLFTGPKKIFNESKTEAIQFLEASIKRAFNLEVSPNSDRFLDSVTLLEQTLVRDTSSPTKRRNNNNKRHLQTIGRSLKLLNFYTVTGRCRSCRTNAKLLTNDAVKRRQLLKESLKTSSRRSLQQSSSTTTTTTSQDTPVTRFEDRLVRILTNQDRFRMFLSITNASISNTIPPNITQVESIIIEPNDDRPSPEPSRPPTASPTSSPNDFSWVTSILITNDSQDDPFQLVGSSP